MDGSRFDELTQRLASIRLTRGSALRGIVASGLTLVGITQVAETGMAQGIDESHRSRRRNRRVNYCQCDNAEETCTSERGTRRERRQELRTSPCSYKGRCKGTGTRNPCEGAGAPITVNITLLGDSCTVGVDDCDGPASGLECTLVGTDGFCLPIDLGEICAEDADCSTGRCLDLLCAECPGIDICGDGPDAQCCVVEASCIGGFCVLPIDTLE